MQVYNIIDTLSTKDLKVLTELNIDLNKITNQYEMCAKGCNSTRLVRVASINDGITYFSEFEKNEYVSFYNNHVKEYLIEKFVPASGAASRMFKFLIDFVSHFNPKVETLNAYINKHNAHDVKAFFIGIDKFSFYSTVRNECIKVHSDYESLSQDYKLYYFVKMMLDTNHFGYAVKPKALIPFHSKNGVITTPIIKHLQEATSLSPHNPKIHFTVAKEFVNEFNKIIKTSNINCEVTFSNQLAETDSIAFDTDNNIFRTSKNDLLFRPGGHGALIENLNDLTSDVIFIKNIDNVSCSHLNEVIFNEKFLGGVLIKHQKTIFNILNNINFIESQDNIVEILNYMEKQLNIFIPNDIKLGSTLNDIKLFIQNKLNRPIRVCGMVKNEGEPGGGPFWITNGKGELSLQIVETAQINLKKLDQQLILSQSTHFNPVDIVCGVKDYKGDKFDLTQYVDSTSGFVVEKSHEGRALRAYELPGLWNGAMADWISIFVEVPIETFNPVKTVNDLLKPAHQSK